MSFAINERGCWLHDTNESYFFDQPLCQAIAGLLRSQGVQTVVDLGCGPGFYVKELRAQGLAVDGFDGNPQTEKTSRAVLGDDRPCGVLDFTQEFSLGQTFDCVLCLEVGEHIPADYESIFLDNLTRHAASLLILSWAVEGQGGDGHVNCRNNDYVIDQLAGRGWVEVPADSQFLRAAAQIPWFRHTVMVFWHPDCL